MSSSGSRAEFLQALVKDAGKVALSYFLSSEDLSVESKGRQDMFSRADTDTEMYIRNAIEQQYPDDCFYGEESHASAEVDEDSGIWVVDPIDGTQPFLLGMRTWCVSISFIKENLIVLGAVYNPCDDELFFAKRGLGATLNGETISCSSDPDLSQGLIGVGYSNRVEVEDTLEPLDALLRADGMFHRNGSGALSLAYVACGRLLGYFEPHMNVWDSSAGVLLIQEAGGASNNILTCLDDLKQGAPVLASGGAVFSQLRNTIDPLDKLTY